MPSDPAPPSSTEERRSFPVAYPLIVTLSSDSIVSRRRDRNQHLFPSLTFSHFSCNLGSLNVVKIRESYESSCDEEEDQEEAQLADHFISFPRDMRSEYTPLKDQGQRLPSTLLEDDVVLFHDAAFCTLQVD